MFDLHRSPVNYLCFVTISKKSRETTHILGEFDSGGVVTGFGAGILPSALLAFSLSRDVKLELKTLKENMREYNKKDAKFYGNIFAKITKLQNMDTNGAGGETKEAAAELMNVDNSVV